MANPTGREWMVMWGDAERLLNAIKAGDHAPTAISQLQERFESSVEAWVRVCSPRQHFSFDNRKAELFSIEGVNKVFTPLSEEPIRYIQMRRVKGNSRVGEGIDCTFSDFFSQFLCPRFEGAGEDLRRADYYDVVGQPTG